MNNKQEASMFLNDVLRGLRSPEVRHSYHETMLLFKQNGIDEDTLTVRWAQQKQNDKSTLDNHFREINVTITVVDER